MLAASSVVVIQSKWYPAQCRLSLLDFPLSGNGALLAGRRDEIGLCVATTSPRRLETLEVRAALPV
jgi:hypothetical protein